MASSVLKLTDLACRAVALDESATEFVNRDENNAPRCPVEVKEMIDARIKQIGIDVKEFEEKAGGDVYRAFVLAFRAKQNDVTTKLAKRKDFDFLVVFSHKYGVNDTDIVKFFVTKGFDINAYDGVEGNTLLHKAVMEKNEKMIRALIENKADLNAKNNDGKTALDLAFEHRYIDIINLLYSKEAPRTVNIDDAIVLGASSSDARASSEEYKNLLKAFS